MSKNTEKKVDQRSYRFESSIIGFGIGTVVVPILAGTVLWFVLDGWDRLAVFFYAPILAVLGAMLGAIFGFLYGRKAVRRTETCARSEHSSYTESRPVTTSVLLAAIGLIAAGFIFLLFWQISGAGEIVVQLLVSIFVFFVFLFAYFAVRSRSRRGRYAWTGVMPGFLVGGVLVGWVAWLGPVNDEWGDLAAVSVGILGAFAGAFAGAALGGHIGQRRDRRQCANR